MIRIIILLLCCVSLYACARPTGDFGRAKPGIVHDEVLPTAGKLRALIFGEPVSGFNWTDQEIEMHNRTWRFLIAPHTYNWFVNVLVEWQRTRLTPRFNGHMQHNWYYELLRFERHRSSTVRYTRVTRDVDADIGTIGGVFRAICAVQEVDRQRRIAADSLPSVASSQYGDILARRAENQIHIDWFVASVSYRYHAYSHALERLLVETPHEGAQRLDGRLSDYAVWVDRAEAHDFCNYASAGNGAVVKSATSNSRMKSRPFSPEPNFRK